MGNELTIRIIENDAIAVLLRKLDILLVSLYPLDEEGAVMIPGGGEQTADNLGDRLRVS